LLLTRSILAPTLPGCVFSMARQCLSRDKKKPAEAG
jgi:hypothetical protein